MRSVVVGGMPSRDGRQHPSGPSLTYERRKKTGHPFVAFTLDEESLDIIEAILAGGHSPVQEGKSGVVRRALRMYYSNLYGPETHPPPRPKKPAKRAKSR